MRIVLAPYGTYGDVVPMVPLARRLREDGHDVLFCATPEYGSLRDEVGTELSHYGTSFLEAMRTMPDIGVHPIAGSWAVLQFVGRQMRPLVDELVEAAEGADILVGSGFNTAGALAARILRIPYRFIALCPQLIPSRSHPPISLGLHGLPRWVNGLAWKAEYGAIRLALRPYVKRIERKAGRKLAKHPVTAWLGYHPIVATDPELGPVPSDTRLSTTQTGFLEYLPDIPMPDDLLQFIDAGPPPIFIGFGSMVNESPKATTDLLVGAARKAGQRLILLSGWSRLGGRYFGADVFIESRRVPFHKLFPRVAAVIHHGGSGTIGTAARAGVPQVIVPHGSDQFYWANRIATIELGPRAMSRIRLDGEKLGLAIHEAVTNPRFTDSAQRIRDELANSDGIGLTAEAIVAAVSRRR